MSNNPNEKDRTIAQYLDDIGRNKFDFVYEKPNKTPDVIELDHHTLFQVTDYTLRAYGSVYADEYKGRLEIDDIEVIIEFYNEKWEMFIETHLETFGGSDELKPINQMLGFNLCKRILKDFENE